MRLHVPSFAIGLALCATLVVTMSLVAPGNNSPRIEYGPNPRDMVQIKEGTPYTVPAGTMFVLTGLGSAGSSGTIVTTLLKVNGQLEEACTSGTGFGVPSVMQVPSCFTASAGSLIEVDDQLTGTAYQTGRAWGYLSK